MKTKALVKTVDNKLFQRGQVFFGHPDMKNYTIEADVLSDGNKRKMSEVGLINQRYLILLKGNSQELEINSNQERIKVAVPFKWAANTWYASRRAWTRPPTAAPWSGPGRGKKARTSRRPGRWRCRTSTATTTARRGCLGLRPRKCGRITTTFR